MGRICPLLLLCILYAKCMHSERERQHSFDSFDFSYNDVFSRCFSIRFTSGDTVFIRYHFSSRDADNRKSNTTYFGLLSSLDRKVLDSFINHTNFADLDTLYYQDYQDGLDYQFYVRKDTIEKLIRVHTIHSDSTTKQLDAFMNWISEKSDTLKLVEMDTVISFVSTHRFLPPPLPDLNRRKFLPPSEEETHNERD